MDKHIPILDIHRSARKIHSQERLALPECLPENGLRFGHGKTGVGFFDIFSSGWLWDASRNTRFESRSSHHLSELIEMIFVLLKPRILHFHAKGRMTAKQIITPRLFNCIAALG
ncbi:hypothetical protein [Gluconobacter oxydans]|uniref:Uncharacterized protein n=2 Tax=Gluconobacter oxydans TaxID=442 RepID=Q5FR65_GLUOX|nr:hypothetical protein [Gluconobacter oxydans]AAW61131.1 Hypothetical protein GOX1379 [Gluconobacter oxydans 621H]MBF0857473.1 hypothetical protein [Gluconobacter oxydans]